MAADPTEAAQQPEPTTASSVPTIACELRACPFCARRRVRCEPLGVRPCKNCVKHHLEQECLSDGLKSKFACNQCRAAKKTCDKQRPCGRCLKRGIECTALIPKEAKPRSKKRRRKATTPVVADDDEEEDYHYEEDIYEDEPPPQRHVQSPKVPVPVAHSPPPGRSQISAKSASSSSVGESVKTEILKFSLSATSAFSPFSPNRKRKRSGASAGDIGGKQNSGDEEGAGGREGECRDVMDDRGSEDDQGFPPEARTEDHFDTEFASRMNKRPRNADVILTSTIDSDKHTLQRRTSQDWVDKAPATDAAYHVVLNEHPQVWERRRVLSMIMDKSQNFSPMQVFDALSSAPAKLTFYLVALSRIIPPDVALGYFRNLFELVQASFPDIDQRARQALLGKLQFLESQRGILNSSQDQISLDDFQVIVPAVTRNEFSFSQVERDTISRYVSEFKEFWQTIFPSVEIRAPAIFLNKVDENTGQFLSFFNELAEELMGCSRSVYYDVVNRKDQMDKEWRTKNPDKDSEHLMSGSFCFVHPDHRYPYVTDLIDNFLGLGRTSFGLHRMLHRSGQSWLALYRTNWYFEKKSQDFRMWVFVWHPIPEGTEEWARHQIQAARANTSDTS